MTKKRRLKKWVKVVIGGIVGIVLLSILISTINNLQEQARQKELNEIKEYQQCIYDQHKEQSYIIRSNCSSNWKILDKKANIEYKQVKMDLYLVSIDNLEV